MTGGEAHDCPPSQRLIRRTKPAKKFLADRAYDSADLRLWLEGRGTKPVIPNKSNRKQPFKFDRKSYKLRHRIENLLNHALLRKALVETDCFWLLAGTTTMWPVSLRSRATGTP